MELANAQVRLQQALVAAEQQWQVATSIQDDDSRALEHAYQQMQLAPATECGTST